MAIKAFIKPMPWDEAKALIDQAKQLHVHVPMQLLNQAFGTDEQLSLEALATVIASEDESLIEPLAQVARERSLRHFGKGVQLYTPIYLSNECINGCLYCGYSADNHIARRTLSFEEAMRESDWILNEGLRHLLVLSGESEKAMPFEAFSAICEAFIKRFSSVSVETYALAQEDYETLAKIGVYGVTLYQETYDRDRYEYLHPYGPKADFDFRFEAPERVARANLRHMNLGILMGLSDWQTDLLMLIAHGKALQAAYPSLELSFSLPRIILEDESVKASLGIRHISDYEFVKALCILRLAFPRAAINCSTRESFEMRKHLIPIGINKMSASVSTAVGGHLDSNNEQGTAQFNIADQSSVVQIKRCLESIGYHSVLSDWLIC